MVKLLCYFYRQVPRKTYLAGGDESAQSKNDEIQYPGYPALPARLHTKRIYLGCSGNITNGK
jgi:hypothetical protein